MHFQRGTLAIIYSLFLFCFFNFFIHSNFNHNRNLFALLVKKKKKNGPFTHDGQRRAHCLAPGLDSETQTSSVIFNNTSILLVCCHSAEKKGEALVY